MVDILKKVEEFLDKEATVWAEYPDVPGFLVQVAFVGREEMQKIFDKYTSKKWNKQTRRVEDVLDRDRLLKTWSARTIKDWKGLTLEGVAKILPIKILVEDNPAEIVPCDEVNKVTLLRHSADFDTFVVTVASDLETFNEFVAEKKAETSNLKP